jgi:hypothetical protein
MRSNFLSAQPVRLAHALAAGLLLALAIAVPSASSAVRDSDRDGMPNRWERAHDLNPYVANAAGDPDRDGLVNLREYRHGTDPRREDSDRDGVDDRDEVVAFGSDPRDADGDGDGKRDGDEDKDHDGTKNEDEDDPKEPCAADDDDGDHDGVANEDENEQGTSPAKSDSDGDGTKDGDEDADEDGIENEDEDDTGEDACEGDRDKDGVDEEDENDVIGVVVSYDPETGVLDIETSEGHLVGTVGEETLLAWSDCDCEGLPVAEALVPGARVEKAILEEGAFWKVRLLCDENGEPEDEPEEVEE